jgi:hypothetical protein
MSSKSLQPKTKKPRAFVACGFFLFEKKNLAQNRQTGIKIIPKIKIKSVY